MVPGTQLQSAWHPKQGREQQGARHSVEGDMLAGLRGDFVARKGPITEDDIVGCPMSLNLSLPNPCAPYSLTVLSPDNGGPRSTPSPKKSFANSARDVATSTPAIKAFASFAKIATDK